MLIVGAMLLVITVLHAQTADSTALKKTARELLEMSGGGKLGARVLEQLTSTLKERLPNVPNEFWTELNKEIKPDDLVAAAIPVYTKHFTVKEMKDIMAFYKTPSGAKLVQAMPDITQDMMRVGQEWGKDVGQRVMQRLQDKGYIKPAEKK
jgi:hypothetical protein